MKRVLTCFFTLLLSYYCSGQAFTKVHHNLSSDKKKLLVEKESERINKATFIVILPFYKSKVDHLNEMLSNSNNDKAEKRMTQLQKKTIADRDSFNLDYLNNFAYGFTETKVEFIYDKDLLLFLEEPNTRYFLSGLYENKPDQKFEETYFFGGFYHDRTSNSSSGYYFVVSDEKLNIYPKSMFSMIRVDNILTHLLSFGFNNKHGRAETIGKKVNNKMEKIQ